MLNWNIYPGISKIEGEEVLLKNPKEIDVIYEIENLSKDEYLVLDDYKTLPKKKNGETYLSWEFMKTGPELKVKVVDQPARTHIEREIKRFDYRRPKRGYKWNNPRNKTSVFVPLSSLIEGAKIFSKERNEIKVKSYKRRAHVEVPSREYGSHRVALNPIPDKSGKNWYEFQGECDCGKHFYYKHGIKKYKNPEIHVCPHMIAAYYKSMESFMDEEGHAPALFPGPTENGMEMDERLARTFVKERYKRRLKDGERNKLLSEIQGIQKDCFSFNLSGGWVEKIT